MGGTKITEKCLKLQALKYNTIFLTDILLTDICHSVLIYYIIYDYMTFYSKDNKIVFDGKICGINKNNHFKCTQSIQNNEKLHIKSDRNFLKQGVNTCWMVGFTQGDKLTNPKIICDKSDHDDSNYHQIHVEKIGNENEIEIRIDGYNGCSYNINKNKLVCRR